MYNCFTIDNELPGQYTAVQMAKNLPLPPGQKITIAISKNFQTADFTLWRDEEKRLCWSVSDSTHTQTPIGS